MKKSLRATDTIARLGGDEFAILMPETGAEAAQAAVARIRDSFPNTAMSNGKPVTFSIGVMTNDCRSCHFDEMIKAADALMYKAKREGKNTVRCSVVGPET
ncbi:MAG: GGDEF domain-containing protein [Candidatus Omnitrophica bacterium]|nr:GGDEF domain-containing protein [Candidatus Omnitrophota bacterium]